MEANKFIKEFGWELAKRDVAAIESGFIEREYFIEHYGFDILDDLKRLVESHELVEKHGGLENAKDDEGVANDFGLGHKGLKQAIADVESTL